MESTESTPTRSPWTILAWVVAAVAVGLAWFAPDALSRLRAASTSYAAMDPSCTLADGPCQATFADGIAVTLSVDPPHAPTAEPLTFTVGVAGDGPAPSTIDILGVDMYMGLTRVPLRPTGTPGEYAGEATLPLCTTRTMRWRADVLFGGRAAGFDLLSTRP